MRSRTVLLPWPTDELSVLYSIFKLYDVSGCLACGVHPCFTRAFALTVEPTSIFYSKDSAWSYFPRQTLHSRVPERGRRKVKPMEAIFLEGCLGFGTLRIQSHINPQGNTAVTTQLLLCFLRQDIVLAMWSRMILHCWSSCFHLQSAGITTPPFYLGFFSSKCLESFYLPMWLL